MKKTLLILLISINVYAQTQIGGNINGAIVEERLGSSISLSDNGSILAVRSSNYVRVYENIGNIWTQIGQDITDLNEIITEGINISLSNNGSIIAISAPFNDNNGGVLDDVGKVRIYKNISNVWTQIGQDIVGAIGERIGISLNISESGNIVAFGAVMKFGETGPPSGIVRVYENLNNTWVKIGDDIIGENKSDNFGHSISLSNNGTILAVGAPGADGVNGYNSGHARIYENINDTWTQIGQDIDGERGGNFASAGGDNSGFSISLSGNGNIIAIGAPSNYINFPGFDVNAGHILVYENVNGTWTQFGTEINGDDVNDELGYSLSLSDDGTILSVGARYASTTPGPSYGPGVSKVFQYISGVWTQIGLDIYGTNNADEFGSSIALSGNGNTLAIGAYSSNPSNISNSGQIRVFSLSAILSIDELLSNETNIFPNPSHNEFIIQLHQGNQLKEVSLYTSLGRYVNTFKTSKVNTANIMRGIYFAKIETIEGKVIVKKIILE